MSGGARLIIDFHGLDVPNRLLVGIFSGLAPYMEEMDDFGLLTEELPLPEDGLPLIDLRLEGRAGPEEHDIARALAEALAAQLPRGTRIALPEIPA
ncbi:hypothetical protein [Oceanicola sp. S124]|uniref:hypothetical protein n=1 Tax=Oceanicola sp. S124 TaxID=1042378 RepID=UPI000255A18A|nr:hypothetical protein [Oceanicola sp. S124]